MTSLPPIAASWTPTRDTLRLYSRVAGGIRRNLVPAHPRWWHVSLAVDPRGLTTGPVAAPGGGSFRLTLDLERHRFEIDAEGAPTEHLDLASAPPATALGEWVTARLAGLGVAADLGRDYWRDDDGRRYDSAAAADYRAALLAVEAVFGRVREGLDGERSPIQLWPHHFDLSFEWFGDRTVRHEEDGERREAPAQIGFGWSPGDEGHPRPYFYANPWPFEEAFARGELPEGCRWHLDGWQGGLLPYDAAVAAGPGRVEAFLRTVHRIAAPALSVEPG